jgi:hypothetical protein
MRISLFTFIKNASNISAGTGKSSRAFGSSPVILRRIFMKKIFSVVLILIIVLASCASTTPPEPTPEPVPQPAPPPTQPQPVSPPPPPPPPVVQILRHPGNNVIIENADHYTVKPGDTLVSIARQFYHDGSWYPLIMMVSDEVEDPDLIEPGMVLTIPNLQVNMNDALARSSIDDFLDYIVKIEQQRGRRGTAALIQDHID